ncbi:MAG: glycosyltransferase [Acidobacteriaceae bacterium]|nr:glycosyltransferase [Acidobacteriaceae bacterium]
MADLANNPGRAEMPVERKPRFLFSLDTAAAVPLNSRESYLKGWFVPADEEAFELWLVVGEKRIPVFTGLPRPDVAQNHKHELGFKKPGFVVRFGRPQPSESVRLIATTKSHDVVLADAIPCQGFLDAIEDVAKQGIRVDYQYWLAESESSLFWPELDVASRLSALPYRPLISILLYVPESHPYLVTRCVESVLQQHYSHWQLCVARDSVPPGPEYVYLERVASEDSRVKLLPASSGRLSDELKRALNAAEGEFVLRLDYRDELHPFALVEIARALNTGEDIDLVYTDEDEMNFYGKRLRPFFKPEFDFEAFLSWNFIGNGAAIRRNLLLEGGAYTTETDDPDDSGLLLRILERMNPSRVRHVPKPLYHLRIGHDATAPLPRGLKRRSSKPVEDYIARTGREAVVWPSLFPESFRLRPKLTSDTRVAVFIRTEDGSLQHAALAADIDRGRTQVYELLGSGADLLTNTAQTAGSRSVSKTLRHLGDFREDVFVFINRPLEAVNHFFFEELAAQAMRPDCGLVTGISLDLKSHIVHSGFRRNLAGQLVDDYAGLYFPRCDYWEHFSVLRSVYSISDEFFAVKRSQLAALGGFGAVSSNRMRDLVQRLVALTHTQGAHVLVTPYAIGTFELVGRTSTVHADVALVPSLVGDTL